MHKSTVLYFLTAAAILITCVTPINAKSWSTYRGAWFRISYPSGFTVRPSLKGSTTSKGYDSAFFISPDKKVEFYIFSPQWSGEPSDAALKPKTEKLVSTKKDKTTTWTTISAKNGHYIRSLLDIKKDGARWVFGIKYADSKSLAKYKKDYVRFKQSLVQYAD